MESNINLYKFIFSKHFSANKQHKYTHDGYFSTTRNSITHKSRHIHHYYSRPYRGETTITTTQLVILNLNGLSYIQWKL